jgi:hypothetical protein
MFGSVDALAQECVLSRRLTPPGTKPLISVCQTAKAGTKRTLHGAAPSARRVQRPGGDSSGGDPMKVGIVA